MTNTIITIGREFGSGGCEIGHKLAEKLGIKCYDRDYIGRNIAFCKAMMKNQQTAFCILW